MNKITEAQIVERLSLAQLLATHAGSDRHWHFASKHLSYVAATAVYTVTVRRRRKRGRSEDYETLQKAVRAYNKINVNKL